MNGMARWAWVGALLLVGCGRVPDHSTMGLAIDGQSCFDCHGDRYLATTSPDHVALGYPQTCEDCHSTETWRPASAGHDFWPLVGTHEPGALSSLGVETSCESCHSEGYAGTPTQCDDCHHPEYAATTDPSHADVGFPTTCADCHDTVRWGNADVSHDFWPLTGTHVVGALSSLGVATSCESCHSDGFAGTPTQCDDCHHPEYVATTDPSHADAGYPTTCETCHTTDRWEGATVNHDFWPLVGIHQIGALSSTGLTTSCESCHTNGYEGTPTTCDDCHHDNYVATTAPSHAQVGIPTSCDQCHTPSGWDTDTFPQHDALFPISTGDHRRFTCTECHTTPNTFSAFTCTGCHTGEHNLSKMNAEHQGEVWNYQSTLDQYGVDQGCLHCHPDGREHDD